MLTSSARETGRAMAQTTVASWRQRAFPAMGVSLPRRVALRRGGRAHRLDHGRVAERLEHRAVALGSLHQALEVLFAGVRRVDLEAHPDRVEAGADFPVDAERAAQVEVAVDDHLDALG